MTNCTIVRCSGDAIETSITSGGTSNPVIKNTILAINGDAGIRASAPATVTFSDAFSNAQGNFVNVTPGTGVIQADPRFRSATDLHLQAASPCINTGDPALPNDADNTRSDMGAFPHLGPGFTSINPTSGVRGQTNIAFTINGVNLTDTNQIRFLLSGSPDPNITVSNLQVVNDNQVTATLDIAAGAALGDRVVQVVSTTRGASNPAFGPVFFVGAVRATQLVFTVQPSNTVAGQVITPAIQIAAQDDAGNTDTNFTGDITIAIGTNPSGGMLSGTTTKAAVTGVATFDDLSIDKAGVGYTLTASATGLTAATSAPFDITGAAPSVPTSLSPADNFTVSPTPLFKLQTTDPEGDQVKFVLELTQGATVLTFETDFIASGTETTFAVPLNQALSQGAWTWRVKAVDSSGLESAFSDSRTFMVPSATPAVMRSGGLNTFGLALRLGTTPADVGLEGVPIAAWDADNQRYVLNEQVTQLQLGAGYWVKVANPIPVRFAGEVVTEAFAIALKQGWNLISAPFLSPVLWDVQRLKVRKDGVEKSLLEAREADGKLWVEAFAWGWLQDVNNPNTGRYFLISDQNFLPGIPNQLRPWQAYWVFANVPCELVISPPERGRELMVHRRTANAGWSVRLAAQTVKGSEELLLGVSQGQAWTASQPPEPPTGRLLQVGFVQDGRWLTVDVRNGMSKQQVWDVVVRWRTGNGDRGLGQRQEEMMLTWDGVGYAPKDVNLTLVDLATGARCYMRTQTAYRFVPSDGETERRFKVIAESGNTRPLRIVSLKAMPLRGQGVIVEFALTKPAQVQAEVLTLTGRRVAVLEVPRSSGSLVHRLVWRGDRDDGTNGTKVSMGVYLVRVQAVDEEGRQVQAVTQGREVTGFGEIGLEFHSSKGTNRTIGAQAKSTRPILTLAFLIEGRALGKGFLKGQRGVEEVVYWLGPRVAFF